MRNLAVDVWGVEIVNVTPHNITFRNADGSDAIKTIAPSGIILSATPSTNEIRVGNKGVVLIRTMYIGNGEGHEFLSRIPTDSSVIVVGSIVAALAYPGKVKALMTWKGHKSLTPNKRMYLHSKFKVFL